MKKAKQNGFTLVELVIIIVIIAVISAITVPSLKRAINNANEAGAIAAIRVISQGENAKFITSGEFLTLGRLSSEGVIDERFGGLDINATEAETTSYKYKLTFINLPSGERNYVLSAIPASTNALTRTGTKRFGVSKNGLIVYDSTNFFTHYETLEDLETGIPIGNN